MDQHHDSLNDSLDGSTDGTSVSVHAGFPNAGADRNGSSALDFNRLLIQNPSSTFIFRIRGDNHERRGIFDGDIAVIDRALAPRRGNLVIEWREGGFVLATYRPAAPGTDDGEAAVLFGVITAIIHPTRRRTGGSAKETV